MSATRYYFVKINDASLINDVTEIKTFYSPIEEFPKIKRVIEEVEKAGENVIFEDLGTVTNDSNQQFRAFKFGYDLENKNWEFIGTIFHKDRSSGEQNEIITSNSQSVPKEFYSKKPNCDHCNLKKEGLTARKYTYIVKNKNDNTYKQVGSSCLENYTGLNADLVSLFEKVLLKINKTTNEFEKGSSERSINNNNDRYLGDDVKMAIYAVMKTTDTPYASQKEVLNMLKVPSSYQKYKDEIKEIDNWLKENNEELYSVYKKSSIVNVIQIPSSNFNKLVQITSKYFKHLKSQAKIEKLESNVEQLKLYLIEYSLEHTIFYFFNFERFLNDNPSISEEAKNIYKNINDFVKSKEVEKYNVNKFINVWNKKSIDEMDYIDLFKFIIWFDINM